MKRYPQVNRIRERLGFLGFTEDASYKRPDFKYAQSATNFAFEHGLLTGGIGVDAAKNFASSATALPEAPKPIKKLFFYKFAPKSSNTSDDRLVAHMTDGTFAYISLLKKDVWHTVEDLVMKGEVTAVNYNYNGNDQLLLCSADEPLYLLADATPFVCGDAPHFSCFAVHSERLFGGVNGARPKLWFSDDFDPYNWKVSAEEAGYISFDDEYGDIICLLSFLGYLYIIREYAIFRLTAFGAQSGFELKKVYINTARIEKGSVTVCGGVILFISDLKLYSFDGYSVRRVMRDFCLLSDAKGYSGAYLGDYYYLCCRTSARQAKFQSDTLLRYDIAHDSPSMMTGFNPLALLTVRDAGKEGVFVCFEETADTNKVGVMSKSGSFLGAATSKSYTTVSTDLGSENCKTLRTLTMFANVAITLTVTVDGSAWNYEVPQSTDPQTIEIFKTGKQFSIKLACTGTQPKLSPPIVEVDIHSY